MVPTLVLSPVNHQPKAIRLHNGASDFIVAGNSVQQSTSPLNTTPSPLRKQMALLVSNMNQFKGDRVCKLICGTAFYGKLWNIKFDYGEEEDVTLS